jgi:hypothetical protein
MKLAAATMIVLLGIGCQTHQPLDKSSTNPSCQGYSDGFTERC